MGSTFYAGSKNLSRKKNMLSNEAPYKGDAMEIKKPAAIDKIKDAWNENPILVIGVGAAAVTATAKLIDAVSAAQGRRAYAKQVDHRVKNNRAIR